MIGGVIGLVPVVAGLMVWLDPVRRRNSVAGGFTRVATLDALPADGVPRKFTLFADRVDAWTRTPQVPVGAIYLRRTGPRIVTALHSVCPHAGCFVDYQPKRKGYFCPCHNSVFAPDGSLADLKSPSPRSMDTLELEVRGNEVWVRFQNFQAGHKEKRTVV